MIKYFIKLILLVNIFFVTSVFAEVREVDFGVLIPLTGNAADQGEWERKGFELAREEINSANKYKVNLIYEDVSGADAKAGVQAYKSLMFKKKVPVVFSYGSGVGMALTPLVNQDKVVQMGVATGTPAYSSEGDYTFRNFPSASLEADFNVRVLKESLKLDDIAILQVDNAYGEGYKKAFLEKFKGNIVFQQTYDPGETDFRTLILKVRNSKAKLLYLIAYTNDGALILKQLRQLSFNLPVLGTGGIAGGENFFKLVGDSAEGLYVFGAKFDGKHPFLKSYNEKYNVTFNNPAQVIFAARAYDALKIVISTLDQCPSAEATCIKDELYKIKDYPSVCGNISFDKNGDINSNFAGYQIKGREFVPVY